VDEIPTAKFKKHNFPHSDQILARQAPSHSEIHKLINYIWSKGELPDHWKEPITAPIYKKDDKTDCRKYKGLSLLPILHKILSRHAD
jgi:hypothetical protein